MRDPPGSARYTEQTMRDFIIRPIGIVRRNESVPAASGLFVDPRAEAALDIDPIWEPGLTGIEAYSHLVVLFWLDRSDPRDPAVQTQRPERREDLDEVGFFATRSPVRPNPVGIACPRLIARDGTRLVVEGIDAWDGTPIVDIKGYTPRDESRPDATVPDWLRRLWTLHDTERG
jgi:tRNA (adenine37-N6)-methyltransferase